jgi:hypothetical protein
MNKKLLIGDNVPVSYKNSINSLIRYLDEIKDQNIPEHQLDITDIEKWKFETIASWSHITISEKSLNILWCYSLAYYDYYKTICFSVQPKGQEINLKDSNALNQALIALSWSTDNFIETEETTSSLPLEIRLPQDYDSLTPDSPEYLFETALAFYYLHEVGHIYLRNEKFKDLLSEEIFCDDYSIDKLLKNCNSEELKWRKRGVGLGLTLMNVFGMHTGFYDGISHPFAYDRITDALDKKIIRSDDDFWGWVVALFSLHMTENRIKQPTEEFEDFRETVDEYKKILEKHKNKSA